MNKNTAAFKNLSERPAGEAQPKYERLRDYVVSQIESGQFKAGSALPSENSIAEQLQVARSTVRQALAELEKDGLVRRVHGKGTFVHEDARSRLTKGPDLFALIVPETETGFYPSLQRSFEAAAAELHNQVIVRNTGNDIDRQGNAILQLIDLQVAGVAIVPTTNPKTPVFHIRQLQKHGIPVVCCSRPIEGGTAPLLGIPFEEVGHQAGEALRRHRHRHVAFLGGYRTDSVKLIERGFSKALGESAEISYFHLNDSAPSAMFHERAVANEIERLFTLSNPPTAIFTTFDSFAEMIYLLLSRRGLRIPQDVSIVGFGGVRRTGPLTSLLTSVTLDEVTLGREAISILHGMRHGQLPFEFNEHHDLKIGLSDGQSLAFAKS